MPDTEDDLKKLTAGEATAIVSAWTALDTRVDDAPEDPNFARELAKRLTSRSHLSGRLPPVAPHRALTADEAHAWALSRFDGSRFTYHSLLDTCWKRLPGAGSPQIALSYQRLIHALTTLQAWMDWKTGRDVIEERRKEAAANLAWYNEQQALDRWRERCTGIEEPTARNAQNAE